jgi:hypothetical protein
MAKYLKEKHISKAIFKAIEGVIRENKYVTYDPDGNAILKWWTE